MGGLGLTLGVAELFCTPVSAQERALPLPSAEVPLPFEQHRYDEDYAYLSNPARRTEALDALKHITLGSDPETYLTLGGELRARYEVIGNPGFNFDRSTPRNDYLLGRLLVLADLHLGPNFRIFGQLGSYRVGGEKSLLGSTQDNPLEAQQIFAEVTILSDSGAAKIGLRVGRQEMSFGSSRLIGFREGPNVRRSFDGGRVLWRAGDGEEAATIDAFIVTPVSNRKGAFDDRSQPGRAFWAVYGTKPANGARPGLDIYYLGFRNRDAIFSQGSASELRHTLGTRLYGKGGGFDYDVEAAFQFGRFGTAPIRAWAATVNFGDTWARLPWSPRFGLEATITSGDAESGDSRLGTFNSLFPRLPYFSEAALVTPSNIVGVEPGITIKPFKKLELSIGYDLFWRQRSTDGFYTTPLAPIVGDPKSRRKIGSQVEVLAEWQVTRHVDVRAAYIRFATGPTLIALRGRDVEYIMNSVAFKW